MCKNLFFSFGDINFPVNVWFLEIFAGFLYSSNVTKRFNREVFLDFKTYRFLIKYYQRFNQQMIDSQINITKTAINMKKFDYKTQKTQSPIKEQQPRQLTHQHFTGALIMRNIIRTKLKRILIYEMLMGRLLFKKIAYKLLAKKSSRNQRMAFYTIMNSNNKHSLAVYHQFVEKKGQMKLLFHVCQKFNFKNLKLAFEKIKKNMISKRNLERIIGIVEQFQKKRINRLVYKSTFNRLKRKIHLQKCKEKQIPTLFDIFGRALVRHKEGAFNSIFSLNQSKDCTFNVQIKKSKQQSFKNHNVNRKQALAEIRDKLKKLRTQVDQEKLTKNRSINDARKNALNCKNKEKGLIKQFEKQSQLLEKENQKIYEEKQDYDRLVILREKQQSFESKLENIYQNIIKEENQVNRQSIYLANSFQDIKQFKESANYYFWQNTKTNSKIIVYEKRQNQHYEQQYYDLEHENRVLRETVRCLIARQLQNDCRGVSVVTEQN